MGPEPSPALECLTVTWGFLMHATSSLTPATRPPPRISSETRKQRRVMAHQRGKSLFLAPPHRQAGVDGKEIPPRELDHAQIEPQGPTQDSRETNERPSSPRRSPGT